MISKLTTLFTISFLFVGISSSVFACGEGSDNQDCSCPMHKKDKKPPESSAVSATEIFSYTRH